MPNATPPNAPGVAALPSVLLALALAVLLVPLALLPQLLPNSAKFEVGAPAPLTIRVSPLATSELAAPGSAIALVRGETVTAAQAAFLSSRSVPAPSDWGLLLALLACATLLWSSVVRRQPRCAGLRQHLADIGLTILLAACSATALLFSPLSLFALPIGAIAILSAHRNSQRAAAAIGLVAIAAVGSMTSGGASAMAVLAVQVLVPCIILRRRSGVLVHAVAASGASVASMALYALLYHSQWSAFPTTIESGLATWLSVGVGPIAAIASAALLAPAYIALRGDTSKRSLNRLEKLSQPLLRELAQKAPGSWQHSLAMAKLADAAGKSIGADTQLLRVGAYYHDIGKVAQPRFFIENISGAERSVHESIAPMESCSGIVGHVDKGVELGRSAGLPNGILDFIRTHHGQGLLEYFWTKEQLSAGHAAAPSRLESDFEYPGTLPNSPETGILCICDAVEGASRHLKNPSPEDLADLVHHITFGKVRAGQLTHSGLTLGELQNVAISLTAALQDAHAPAQRTTASRQDVSTAPGSARARPTTSRPSIAGLSGIRLDSHDRPSSGWRHLPSPSQSGGFSQDDAHAATESMVDPGTEETALAVPNAAHETEDLDVPKRIDGAQLTDKDVQESEQGPELKAPKEKEERSLLATRGLRKPDLVALEATPKPKPKPKNEETAREPEAAVKVENPPANTPPANTPPPVVTPSVETPLLLTELKRAEPPSPPPTSRRNTIPLGKDELLIEPATPSTVLAARRADSQDGLKPGEMVIGAPPATHPERGGDAKTALRRMPVPREARRPEDRITEEHLALVPPAAWGDPTAPVATATKSVVIIDATEPQARRPGTEANED